MELSVEVSNQREHTRLSFKVMSVRRVGLSVIGDKKEEVERRAGRDNALL